MAEVALTVNGQIWGGWTSVRIQRSIEQIAGQFSLGLTERWPGQPDRREISPGDSCTVAIDGRVVITGRVDDVEVSFDGNAHAVTVSGRDATGDLVDCSAEHRPGQWQGRTLLQIASELCRPFGVPVRAEVDIGKAFGDQTLQKGETVFEIIERLCRHRAVLAVSDGRGGLVFTRAGAARVGLILQEGKDGNILAARGTFSHRDRFSRYTVLGQAAGSDFTSPEDNSEPAAVATDPMVRRHRPLIVLAEDQGDGASFAARAAWEARVRAGRARRAEVTVQGWSHAAGLWQPNGLVRLDSPWLRIAADMLIAGVEFTLDERGSTTTLSLVRPEAFELTALPEKESVGW